MFKNSIKLSLSVVFSLGILFQGCGEDSNEADKYNVEMWLDSGENQKVLNYLGDCSTYSGEALTDCYLNVGAAYFGMAKFDMISLAKELSKIDENLSDDESSKEFNKIIFSKLDNESLKDGIEYYTKVVDGNDSVCNEKQYDDLNDKQQQACLSINPILISNIVDDDEDDNDTNKSQNVVSIGDVIEFKDALQDAVPELKAEELGAIIDGDDLNTSTQDVNINGTLDSVEATDYALNVFAFSNSWDGNTSVSSDYNKTVTYTNDSLKNKTIKLAKINITSATAGVENKKFYRLIEYGNDYNTTLTTIPNVVCGNDNVELPTASFSDIDDNSTGYLPCVKVTKDADGNETASSFNDSVVNVLNNDDLLTSIALASESEDDNTSDDQKITDFKEDICGIDGSNGDGLCDTNTTTGELIITQEAVIDYMNKDK